MDSIGWDEMGMFSVEFFHPWSFHCHVRLKPPSVKLEILEPYRFLLHEHVKRFSPTHSAEIRGYRTQKSTICRCVCQIHKFNQCTNIKAKYVYANIKQIFEELDHTVLPLLNFFSLKHIRLSCLVRVPRALASTYKLNFPNKALQFASRSLQV